MEYCSKPFSFPPTAADAFICGSDQVWIHCGETPFLSFVPPGRRIAYAPSAPWAECGEAWKAQVREYLPGFAGVSVREDARAELLGGLGISATAAVDSVLPLQKEDCAELVPPSKHHKPYMLVYTLNLPTMQEICAAFFSRPRMCAARQRAGCHRSLLRGHGQQAPDYRLQALTLF